MRYTKNTPLAQCLAAIGLLVFAHSALATPLSAIEDAARANAGKVRASHAERAAASARRDIAENQNSARVFAGTGLSDANEPVTDTYVRNYRRANLSVGVRWTLLAGRLSQKQNVKTAEWDMARAQMREDMAGNDAVRQVRIAAIKAAHADQRAALSKAFLSDQGGMQRQFQARRQAGAMLGAQAMDLEAQSDEVKARLKRQEQVRADAEQTIRHVAHIEGKLDLSNPSWPETCFASAQLMQEDGRGQEAEQQLNVAAANSQMMLLEGGILDSVEAGVQVSHSRMKDWPGGAGHNSGVSLDVSIPLGWKRVRDARISEWSAKRQQAETQLQEARSLRQFDIDKGLRDRALLKSEWSDAQSRLNAAQEALRVATLRRPALDGDGIVEQFQARLTLYKAGIRVVDALERRSLAEAELLALGPECITQEQPATASAATPQLLASLSGALPQMQAAKTPAMPASSTDTRAEPSEQGKPDRPGKKPIHSLDSMREKIGWFVWNGQKLLDDPSLLKQLPQNSGRILLSFSAQQLQKMRADDWKELRAQTLQRGIRIELLLGDPGWVTPQGRESLIRLLSSVQSLPVDGLNLDLERSQLPKNSMDQEQWKRETAATIREVRAATPWELALTTHHRDLDDAAFLSALRSAGLNEVVPMIYTQNTRRAALLTEQLLAHQSGLHVGLAQSIEPILSKEESSFHQGRDKSIQRWNSLLENLSQHPLFSGVIVQSMADYQQAKP